MAGKQLVREEEREPAQSLGSGTMGAFPIQGHAAKGWDPCSVGEKLRVPGRRWVLWETDLERRQRLEETNLERQQRLQPGRYSRPADVGCCQLL